MSNIHQFTSKELILEKASQWISAIDRGLNIQEQEQFKLWMLQSTAHQNAVYELAQLWDDLSVLNELSVLFPNKHSAGIKTKPSYVYGIAASVVVEVAVILYSSASGAGLEDPYSIFENVRVVFLCFLGAMFAELVNSLREELKQFAKK